MARKKRSEQVSDERTRERELVLAPNEYAYVLDTTKGHINAYVGPHKTSLAQTDAPVIFNSKSKQFERTDLHRAIQLFSTAPAGWYMILKNPEKEGTVPSSGNSTINNDRLQVGKKINMHGPVSFPLWPGQMAKVIQGHRLQSNQYLVARIYDADEANRRQQAVFSGTEAASGGDEPGAQEASGGTEFVNGQKVIIQGTDVSFYMPPTGVEVVPDGSGQYVRNAVTLQRLEYCILVSEGGDKAYVKGPNVVFPAPDQEFVTMGSARKFRAIELSDLMGIYVKVIEPYTDDDGADHAEGEELFIYGKNKIYFPRKEHAIIRYGDDIRHYAVAIPKGEGRYVLDRLTGDVTLKRGPCMFLPDPRTQVVTQRVLSDRECHLMYPGNAEVLAHNRGLRGALQAEIAEAVATADSSTAERLSKIQMRRHALARPEALYSSAPVAAAAALEASTEAWAGDKFNRKNEHTKPRTITLDTKFDGAVSVDVWSGYAIQIVDKSGNRRVEQGPTNGVLLAYDETLESLALSTGKPKNTDNLLKTAYLKTRNNYVSDEIGVISSDLVMAKIQVKYLVDFVGGDPLKWFAVDNYVKLLCDHARSKIKAVARKTPIKKLQADLAEIVRDTVLGQKLEGERKGLVFDENSMAVRDVDILYFQITTKGVHELMTESQMEAVRDTINLAQQETKLESQRRLEAIQRELEQERAETAAARAALQSEQIRRDSALRALNLQVQADLQEQKRAEELADAERELSIRTKRLEISGAENDADMGQRQAMQALALEDLRARVQGAIEQAKAYSPELIQAINRLGDVQLLSSIAENFGELATIQGKGLLETAKKVLDFDTTAHLLPSIANGKNGHATAPADTTAE